MLRFIASVTLVVLMGATSLAQVPGAKMTWLESIDQARQIAGQQSKLVLVHFWSPDCMPCLRMDQSVYGQPGTAERIAARYVPVKVNAQQYPMVARHYKVTSWPRDIILAPNGQVIAELGCSPEPTTYLTQLESVALGADSKMNSPYASLGSATPTMPQRQSMAPMIGPMTPAQVGMTPNGLGALSAPAGGLPGPAMMPQGPIAVDERYANYYRSGQMSPPPAAPSAGQVQPNVQVAMAPATAPAVIYPTETTRYNSASPNAGGNTYGAAGGTVPPMAVGPQVITPAPSQLPLGMTGAAGSAPVAAPAPPAPLALDGYCAVTLTESEKWIRGDQRYGAIHRGQTYLFTGPEQQKRFLGAPDRYAPSLSGIDPVLAIDARQTVAGHRRHGLFYNQRVYLFSSETTLNQFGRDPARYAEGVRLAEAAGAQPVRR